MSFSAKPTKILLPCLLLLIHCLWVGLAASQDDDSADESIPFIWGGLAWSPDGEIVAVGTSRGIWLHTSDDLLVIEELGEGCSVTALDWSPDGSRIVSGCSDGEMYIWDVETEHLIHRIPKREPRSTVATVAWCPNNDLIASASWDGNVYIWETETARLLQTIDLLTGIGSAYYYSISWNVDGNQIAVQGRGRMFIWDVEAERLSLSWTYNREIYTPKWSPDGETIASGGLDGEILLWDAMNGELSERFEVGGRTISLSWSPDSTQLAAHNASASDVRMGRVQIWDVITGNLLTELPNVIMTGDGFYNNALEWSLDGTRLASISDDGRIIIWDMETYDEIAVYDDYRSILLPDEG